MRRFSSLLVLFAVVLTPMRSDALEAPRAEPNPWLSTRILNMAHSGGEAEAPMNTLYAFKRAAKIGADMLELDVQSTKDGELVVIHNATVEETTNGTGKVRGKTLAALRKLDAAHWFVPGKSATQGQPDRKYVLRGARTGEVKVKGYAPADFRIPTLKEVFKAFPKTPINVEIKGTSDEDLASFKRTGRLLAKFLDKSGRTDVIVASFKDEALADFHAKAPQIGLAAGQTALTAYFLSGTPLPEGTVSLQVPVRFGTIDVVTPEFVAKAHADGYAVHVWFSGSAPDSAKTYKAMLDTCVDGLMPAKPTVLEKVLDDGDIVRPGEPGTDPCAS